MTCFYADAAHAENLSRRASPFLVNQIPALLGRVVLWMLLAAGSADAAEPEPGAVRAAPPPASPAGASSALATGTHAFPTMDTLESRHRLALGDRLSFRIVEDQEDPREPLDPKQPITVTDSGDVEVPYIGSFPAAGKTCKQLARELKTELEKIPVDPRESAAGA